MSKSILRNLVFAYTITLFFVGSAQAADSTTTLPPPTATTSSVTGTDPVPTSPGKIDMILAVLYLA